MLPTATPDEKVVLKFITYSKQSADFFEGVSWEFEREHPSIDLEFIFMNQEEYKAALPLLFESGQAPDIFHWSTGIQTINKLLDKGWIQPLHPQENVPQEWLARWPDGYFISGVNTHNGQVYSLPYADNKISTSASQKGLILYRMDDAARWLPRMRVRLQRTRLFAVR